MSVWLHCCRICGKTIGVSSALLLALEASTGIELEKDNVTILDDVQLALLAVLPGSLHSTLASKLLEVIKVHDLGLWG